MNIKRSVGVFYFPLSKEEEKEVQETGRVYYLLDNNSFTDHESMLMSLYLMKNFDIKDIDDVKRILSYAKVWCYLEHGVFLLFIHIKDLPGKHYHFHGRILRENLSESDLLAIISDFVDIVFSDLFVSS